MTKRLIPLYARVVVRVESRTENIHEKFKGLKAAGFAIPETAEEKQIPDEGTVIAIGDACDVLRKGDRVLFGKWAAKALDFSPGLFVMMEEDVIGIVAATEEEEIARRAQIPGSHLEEAA